MICLYTKSDSLPLMIISLLKYWYGLDGYSLPNSDVEILTPSLMVSEAGPSGGDQIMRVGPSGMGLAPY